MYEGTCPCVISKLKLNGAPHQGVTTLQAQRAVVVMFGKKGRLISKSYLSFPFSQKEITYNQNLLDKN